jgi:hypothetical protein
MRRRHQMRVYTRRDTVAAILIMLGCWYYLAHTILAIFR